ncbi:hypothetical protein [Duganella violaceipulchra]|uniref:Uncharacterized protein n=1 Tax=Duganella violaceipulchra TaxID=2849652 RepID=A0AA41L8P6_9BURK|nr:hypothetical protein [Duganella violaceicalia]MBV6322420.1 hypothetical protein [Duganella violaceicalia]MCP2010614.1 hypothetical protein [Duganella violaceicalia]
MTPEREREYDELLAYVSHFATVVWKVSSTAEIHPAKTIERVVEQFGKSKALAGLRQAANDTVEETNNWSREAKSTVDEAFKSAGIVTVSEITRRYSASYKRIIKRGIIRDETEYYLIHAVLIDQGNSVANDERAHLQKLTEAYEARA